MYLVRGRARLRLSHMDTFLEFAIISAWIGVSVMAVTRVFTERRRWQRQMSACEAMRMTSAKVRH